MISEFVGVLARDVLKQAKKASAASMYSLRRSTKKISNLSRSSGTAEVGEQCASTLGVQKLRFGGIMIIMARLYIWIFLDLDSCGKPNNKPSVTMPKITRNGLFEHV